MKHWAPSIYLLLLGCTNTLVPPNPKAPPSAEAPLPQVWYPVLLQEADDKLLIELLERVRIALRSENVILEQPAATASRFNTASKPPPQLAPGDLADLGEAIRGSASLALAGDLEGANKAYGPVGELSAAQLDLVAYELDLAQTLLDLCIALAGRDNLSQGQTEYERAKCLFQWSDRRATAAPDHLVESFAASSTSAGAASLTVQVGGAEEGTVCAVAMNGTGLGRAPRTVSGLVPAVVRVQVHCPEPGRSYQVKLETGPNHLDVDWQFDAALRSEGHVALWYHDNDTRHSRLNADLRKVADVLHTRDLVLVSRSAARISFARFNSGNNFETAIAEISVAPDASAAEVRASVGRLRRATP